jgi:hypothetical protein
MVVNITGTDGTPSEEKGFVMMQQVKLNIYGEKCVTKIKYLVL